MKMLITAFSCLALMTQAVVAQEDSNDANQQWEKQNTQTAAKQTYMGSGKMIGAYIYGQNNESIGDINSITVDKEGKIVHVIVGVGGVAGVGETEIAVPWQTFNCECKMEDGEKSCRATLPMTAAQLEEAPSLEAANYAELYDQNWLKKNATFFKADSVTEAPEMGTMMCVTDINGLQLTSDTTLRTASSDADQKTYTSANSDEKSDLGTIEELVFDVTEAKASYVIVGNNSGVLSEKHVAIPFSQVKFSKQDEGYCAKITATSEDLKSAPAVTPGEYQELDLESVRNRVSENFSAQ